MHALEAISPPPPRLAELRAALDEARARSREGGGRS
jgi:hypothetical protein